MHVLNVSWLVTVGLLWLFGCHLAKQLPGFGISCYPVSFISLLTGSVGGRSGGLTLVYTDNPLVVARCQCRTSGVPLSLCQLVGKW